MEYTSSNEPENELALLVSLFQVVGTSLEQAVNKLDGTIRHVTRLSRYNNTALRCQLCDNLVTTGLYESGEPCNKSDIQACYKLF